MNKKIKSLILLNLTLSMITAPALAAQTATQSSQSVSQPPAFIKIDPQPAQIYQHSYLDIDFPQGEQYIIYKDTKYGTRLKGLSSETRQALEPGNYYIIFKYIEKGNYYLISKKVEIKPKTITKIEVKNEDATYTQKLDLDPQIDFIAFTQGDRQTDKIIPYSTLANEIKTLKTNNKIIDITVNDGKAELWFKHSKQTLDQKDISLNLNFQMQIKQIESQQKNYQISTTTPSGYQLMTMRYNDSQYQPTIKYTENNSNASTTDITSNDLTQSNTWTQLKLKRAPLTGTSSISIQKHEEIFPYPIKLQNSQAQIQTEYENYDQRTTTEYPKELKAEIYEEIIENNQKKYIKIRNYNLQNKGNLILDPDKKQIARIYGQNGSKIYDYLTDEIKTTEDILKMKMNKGIQLFMSQDLKEKIKSISIIEPKINGEYYRFDPQTATTLITNKKISPIIEIGMNTGSETYYLSHIANGTLFPMATTRHDATSNIQKAPEKGQMFIQTDKLSIDQSFQLNSIIQNGKEKQPKMNQKGEFNLQTGTLNLEQPLQTGKFKINLDYQIPNSLFDLKQIAHNKEILDLTKYREIKTYGLKTENNTYYLNMKSAENTIETANYEVYDSSGHKRDIKIIDKEGKLYLDFSEYDFKNIYTIVIDHLETKTQKLDHVQFNIELND